jgi:hypothetical protein
MCTVAPKANASTCVWFITSKDDWTDFLGV